MKTRKKVAVMTKQTSGESKRFGTDQILRLESFDATTINNKLSNCY